MYVVLEAYHRGWTVENAFPNEEDARFFYATRSKVYTHHRRDTPVSMRLIVDATQRQTLRSGTFSWKCASCAARHTQHPKYRDLCSLCGDRLVVFYKRISRFIDMNRRFKNGNNIVPQMRGVLRVYRHLHDNFDFTLKIPRLLPLLQTAFVKTTKFLEQLKRVHGHGVLKRQVKWTLCAFQRRWNRSIRRRCSACEDVFTGVPDDVIRLIQTFAFGPCVGVDVRRS